MAHATRPQFTVLKAWTRLTAAEHQQLRTFLVEALHARHGSLERFVLIKLCKVIVDIGKQEWPTQFPELLPMTQQLVQRPETTAVGLLLLSTIVDEFSSAREDIPATRKAELKRVRACHSLGIPVLMMLTAFRSPISSAPHPSASRHPQSRPELPGWRF